MKKILFALVAMFMAISASAQPQGQGQRQQMSPEDMAKRQATQMKETVNLTDAQYEKIYNYYLGENKIQQARRDSMRAAGVQPGQGGQRQGFNREEMQKRQEEELKAIKAILTEEQFAAYQKAQEERRARMGQRGQGGQGGQGGQFGGQRRQRQQN